MIIKRKQASQFLPADGEQPNVSPQARPDGAQDEFLEEEQIDWNEETIETGLAPERRTQDLRSDRRRGYRRIEDKDLISKAHEEAIAIKENAQEQGFQQGLAQARAEIEELRATLANLMNGREEALQSVAGEIGSMAVEIATRIIKTEVSCDETLVMAMVKDTIQKMGRNTKSVLVKVNPDDASNVRKFLKEEDSIPNLNAEIIVMDESTVDLGSCIVETNSGLIDASFSTQLGILRQLFGQKAEGGG